MRDRRHTLPVVFTFFALLLSSASCAHLLPASWKTFPVGPNLARPAVLTALKAKHLPFLRDDPSLDKMVTEWVHSTEESETPTRERFQVWWESTGEKELVIYVRHEGQERTFDGFRATWGSTYHSIGKERDLIEEVEKALQLLHSAMNPEEEPKKKKKPKKEKKPEETKPEDGQPDS